MSDITSVAHSNDELQRTLAKIAVDGQTYLLISVPGEAPFIAKFERSTDTQVSWILPDASVNVTQWARKPTMIVLTKRDLAGLAAASVYLLTEYVRRQ